MVSKADTPGFGLKWPASWMAAVKQLGGTRATARFFGINESTAHRWTRGHSVPKRQPARKKLIAKGYREGIELPELTSTPEARKRVRNYQQEKYCPPEDKARVALFQMIFKRSDEKDPNARFWWALEQSALADIKHPAALEQWTERCKDKTAGARKQREVA